MRCSAEPGSAPPLGPSKKVGYFLTNHLDSLSCQGLQPVIHMFAQKPSTRPVDEWRYASTRPIPLASTSAAAAAMAPGSLPATKPIRKCTSPAGVREEWIEARLMPCCSNTLSSSRNEPARSSGRCTDSALRELLNVFEQHGISLASIHSSRTPAGEVHFRIGFVAGNEPGAIAAAAAEVDASGIGRVLA